MKSKKEIKNAKGVLELRSKKSDEDETMIRTLKWVLEEKEDEE